MINYLNLMVSTLIPIQYSKIFRNITFTPALILVHKYLFYFISFFFFYLTLSRKFIETIKRERKKGLQFH